MLNDAKLADLLSEFARTMVTDFPIQSILDGLVQRIVGVLSVSSAGVTLITPELLPRYVAASDDSALRYETLQSQVGEGPCVLAYTQGRPVVCPDLRAEERFPRFSKAALAAGCAAVFTFPLRHGDGCLGALDLYRDTPGELDQTELAAAQTLADVTASYLINATARDDARAASDRFRFGALHDALTGLPNRVLLEHRLQHASQRARRSHTHSAVFYLDLDRFKHVNDTHGHAVGDELLAAVAQRLSALVRPGDTLARVSGDEFVLLCEDIAGDADTEVLVARIWDAFDRPFDTSTQAVNITASVGIAFAGPGEAISEQLVANADAAMYRAKRAGGAGHHVIDLREANHASSDNRFEAAFRRALAREELHLAYQPIVRATDGAITGVEALLRWTDPLHGAVSPVSMILLAERHGLIKDLGAWVLERACRDHVALMRQHQDRSTKLAVNVSALQLRSPGFPSTVARILADTGLDPSLLILEMTETISLSDCDEVKTVLADVKAMNIQLALDDFGTGYSPLGYLATLPIDIMKIDQRFVTGMSHDRAKSAIVAALINLAHVLELSVTVEGVETRQQSDQVRALGPDAAQGHFYSRPVSTEAVADLLTQSSLPIPA